MKIKNILTACLLGFGLTAALMSCSKNEEAFYTVSEDDAPRILNTDFPDGGYKIERNNNLKIEVLVTPVDFTTVKLYLDDEEKFTGANIDVPVEAGDYTMKIVATTVKGKSTARTMSLKVTALDNDPKATDDVLARLQSPGDVVTLEGTNMKNVKTVKINGRAIPVTSATATSIQYTLPADMPEGQFRMSLIDADGNSFGGGLVTVNGESIITRGDFMGLSEGNVVIPGRKLDKVKSVTVNGVACTIESQTAEQLIIKLPVLEEGTYVMKVVDKNDAAVKFLSEGKLVETGSIKVSLIAEEVVWEGSHDVDWGNILENAEIGDKLKQIARPRATLRLYVKRTDTEYAKGCPAVGWADIVNGGTDPNRGDKDITFDDKYVDFVLTAKSMDLLEQGPFQVVGHGFTLQKITLIQPAEEELWAGTHSVDWGNIWEDDGTITAKLKETAGPNNILRLYVKRTDTEYAKGCAAVGWADIVNGGTDPNRGDVDITFEDTEVDFKLTKKSMELLNGGNLQVVGHGFDLLKITIE